mmetsp:Transcript_2119/g.6332  ORF Transcript_2119/g.6332 Transcript_2119/m.6332 type:complete len:352 (+) Transcript_2119:224-1279(+)|eukprot:CAMPEP_0119291378 /NCGR_PEP_ID=MMETSP1329-20130426/42356_1 /TAXON_ID=114041 /ORGANISM="Genus nov. species nov., Strain RCC1024" /LENGTH=351 /DNA_ID=CAMNT_0007292207 /DNA_START=107 /DNA_END=1162 /DNA_ORIENTATION=-
MSANTVTKVDTSVVAAALRDQIRADVTIIPGVKPKLVGFLANKDPAARKYAEWTGRAATKDGIDYVLREVEAVDLEAELMAANADPGVHGILIYYPVFGAEPSFYGGGLDDQLRDAVLPTKDVEGLCPKYRNCLYRDVRTLDRDRKAIVPCTPLAVVKCLEQCGVHAGGKAGMEGVTCAVVNRSEVVGRPLAAMMANDGATVYSIDIDSIYVMKRGSMTRTDLKPDEAIRQSDVVVLGVPSASYKLPVSTLKPGAVVVNVSGFKNLGDAGDCPTPYTYIPLVGRVTVACLERNLLTLYKQYHVPKLLYRGSLRGKIAEALEEARAGGYPLASAAAFVAALGVAFLAGKAAK